MKTICNIEKLKRPEHSGDWHDKPLKWKVIGPGKELQKFSTKKEALLYRKIRQNCSSFLEACQQFINS